MDLATPFCGFLVGVLVGVTGMGGGSVMTALLILLFSVPPLAAVGTDLLFAAITKATGARVHANRGNVDWRLVGLLAAGSLPGAISAIHFLSQTNLHAAGLAHAVRVAIGIALLLTAAGLLLPGLVKITPVGAQGLGTDAGHGLLRPMLTILLGLVLGVVVTLTSVGAGAIGLVVLRWLRRDLPMVRLVGSDIAHAVPLTALAGGGHWLIGDVQWGLLGALLLGSIPGIVVASWFANRLPELVMRRGLGVVLAGIAVTLVLT